MVLALAPALPLAAQHRMQIGVDTATWASWSGQLRLRGEEWNGFGAGAPAGADHDDSFMLSRLLLRGEIRWKGTVSVVAEAKSAVAVSRDLPGGRRAADEDVADVQQLYAELRGSPLGLRSAVRVGRQELAFGRERLVSPLDWSNTRRTFQGASASIGWRGVEWRPFWVEPVTIRRRKPNTVDSTRQLYGVYATRASGRTVGDVYWLRHEAPMSDRRHTIGTRIQRRPAAGSFDMDVEVAGQSGASGGADVSSYMIGAQIGRSFRGTAAPRVYLGFDAADDEFLQLYPLGHAYLGYIDVHGRRNVIAFNAGLSVQPVRATTMQLDVHHFRRASVASGLYGTDGALARAPGAATSKTFGSEIDLTVRRAVLRNRIVVQAGASRYFAGAFFEQTGPARDITWVYAQLTAAL